jgi:hypothetical protein
MKKLIILISCFALSGCPAYDPMVGAVEITNNSSITIYTYLTCSDFLECDNSFPSMISTDNKILMEDGSYSESEMYPPYRIEPGMKSNLRMGGTLRQPKTECQGNQINIFFIADSIMRTKEWSEICSQNLIIKKTKYNEPQLDSLNWKITFEFL